MQRLSADTQNDVISGSRVQEHNKTSEAPAMNTKRCTSPLKPHYTLASLNPNGSASDPPILTSHRHRSPVHSRVVDVSDIPGATARTRHLRTINPGPYNVDHMNMRDVTSPERRILTERKVLAVNDIEGASPKLFGSRTRITSSPGRGTLYNADIDGATTGSYHNRKAQGAYSHEFSGQPRVMMKAVVPPWGEL